MLTNAPPATPAHTEAQKIVELREQKAALIEALQEITEAKGRFSMDPFEHAKNCVRDMAALAVDALKKYGIEPRRNPETDPI